MEGNIKALSSVTNKNWPFSESLKPINFLRSTLTTGLATWCKMTRTWIPTPTKIPHSKAQNRHEKKVANAGIKSISEKKKKKLDFIKSKPEICEEYDSLYICPFLMIFNYQIEYYHHQYFLWRILLVKKTFFVQPNKIISDHNIR